MRGRRRLHSVAVIAALLLGSFAPRAEAKLIIEVPPGFVFEVLSSEGMSTLGLSIPSGASAASFEMSIYMMELNSDSLRRVMPSPVPEVFAGHPTQSDVGSGAFDVMGDYGGRLYVAESNGAGLWRYEADGSSEEVVVPETVATADLAFDPGLGYAGMLYASQRDGGLPPYGTILRIDPSGVASPPWALLFDGANPRGIAFDITGNQIYDGLLYWVHTDDDTIHRVAPNGTNAGTFTTIDDTTSPVNGAVKIAFSSDAYFGQRMWVTTSLGKIFAVEADGSNWVWGEIAGGSLCDKGVQDLEFVAGDHPLAWDGLPTMYTIVPSWENGELIRVRPDVEVGVAHAEVAGVPARLFASPNPFRPTTRITIDAARGARDAALEIFAPSGRRVDRVRIGRLSRGRTRVAWDARSGSRRALPSGVYFYRLVADGVATPLERVVLVR